MRVRFFEEFLVYVRERGVISLAIGVIISGAVGKLVSSLVQDIIQPLLGYLLGSSEGLRAVRLGPVMFGNFISNVIDFLVIAAVIFFVFRSLKLDKPAAAKP